MNNEQKVFLSILKDFIFEKSGNYDVDNWDVINKYAYKHNLEAIFYYQTHKECFRKAFMHQLYLSKNIKNEADKVRNAIEEYPYFIVKGVEIAELYPVEVLRSMSDIDIVTTPEWKEKIADRLVTLGYKCSRDYKSDLFIEHEWEFYSTKVVGIELHHGLYYRDTFHFYDKLNMDVFNHCWDYVSDHKLDWSFHFLYVITHLMKHLLFLGVGFRQFLDVAVITKNQELDWKWIEDKAKEIGIFTFLKKVLKFNEIWFGIQNPYTDEDIDEDFFEQVTECVFESGSFGSNGDMAKPRIINTERGKGKLANFKAFLKDIFPSYSQMVKVEDYYFIKDRKILLPYAWGYRIVTKWDKRDNIKKNHFIDKRIINERDEYLSEWGL